MEERSAAMEGSCKCIEKAPMDKLQGVVFQLETRNFMKQAYSTTSFKKYLELLHYTEISHLISTCPFRTCFSHRNKKKSGSNKSREYGRCSKVITLCLTKHFVTKRD
jgi:hypothetical protein